MSEVNNIHLQQPKRFILHYTPPKFQEIIIPNSLNPRLFDVLAPFSHRALLRPIKTPNTALWSDNIIIVCPESAVSARDFAHPERDEAVIGDRPRITLLLVSGGRDPTAGEAADGPGKRVEEDVGDDTSNETICDAEKQILSVTERNQRRNERTCR